MRDPKQPPGTPPAAHDAGGIDPTNEAMRNHPEVGEIWRKLETLGKSKRDHQMCCVWLMV
jgi:hypothetical protein